jgi:thymidylate synthase ThyX
VTMTDVPALSQQAPTTRRVYCLVGVPPEIQAYAMARYSRSSQGMLESIAELSAQRAERFLNTFYFQYGHRSIADLAHLVVALENISILAAMRVVDEQLWDGQERSTRYQNFRRSGYEVPAELEGDDRTQFIAAADQLFAEYAMLSRDLANVLKANVPRPESMDPAQYDRTLRARAFDVARLLLPLATRTSIGQVISARVLERQISRLLAEPHPEVQAIGEELRQAAEREAESPSVEYPEPVRAAPTLVKYTAPAAYGPASLARIRALGAPLLAGLAAPERSRMVESADDETPLDELVATLLFRTDPAGHSYRQIQTLVRDLPASERQTLVAASLADRGPHDELLREHQSGYALKLDLLIDLGSYRDLHRHRRCVQITQALTPAHGFDDPAWIFERGLGAAGAEQAAAQGLLARYRRALESAAEAATALAVRQPLASHYLLPLAFRVRALFKLDLAEAAYIAEQRSAPAGHFTYREAAWQIYQALRDRFPELADQLRVFDPRATVDLLQR